MATTGVLTTMLDDESKLKEANDSIILDLQGTMKESEGEFIHLRRKLTITYWVIIILSIVMFVLGLVLITVPILAAFSNDIDRLQSIISAGFGIADLAALFLYGPIERIHKIMGDMSQLILVLNSYRMQVGLRLIQMDLKTRTTVGDTAKEINEVAVESIKLVQKYFEAGKKVKEVSSKT